MNSHKECYEHGIFWPTIQEPSVLTFLEWSVCNRTLYG